MKDRLPKTAADIVQHILHKTRQEAGFLKTQRDNELEIIEISLLAILIHKNAKIPQYDQLLKQVQQQMSLREAKYGFLGTLYSIFWRRDLSTKNDQSQPPSYEKQQPLFQQQNASQQTENLKNRTNSKNQKKEKKA